MNTALSLLTVSLLLSAPTESPSTPEAPLLSAGRWREVRFNDKPGTRLRAVETEAGPGFRLEVEGSGSAFILPFETARQVRRVSWKWKHQGLPGTRDKAHEASKSGDDYLLRVGLILEGSRKSVPFFAPGWLKKLGRILTLPVGRVEYLVLSRHHARGERWPSPYSDQLSYVSIEQVAAPATDAQQSSSHTFDAPRTVVGLWLMADGDDTGARFQVTLSDLRLSAQ